MSLPVTKTSYTQLTNARWFHSRFSLQMQRNSCRKKGNKQRRRLPLTVNTRDSEHKGRGSRPLRIKQQTHLWWSPLFVHDAVWSSWCYYGKRNDANNLQTYALLAKPKPQTRNGSQSFQKAFRNKMSQKKNKNKNKKLGSKKWKKENTRQEDKTRQI